MNSPSWRTLLPKWTNARNTMPKWSSERPRMKFSSIARTAVISISSCDVTARAITTAIPRRPDGAGGEGSRLWRGGILRATSTCRGTTHARFGCEVERKASNLVAHSVAERSSSHSGERQRALIRTTSLPGHTGPKSKNLGCPPGLPVRLTSGHDERYCTAARF
jgi:hypothetical protein